MNEIYSDGRLYWLNKFQNIRAFHLTKSDIHLSPVLRSTHSTLIINDEFNQITEMCKNSNTLLYTFLLTVVKISFAKYTNGSTVIVGSPIINEKEPSSLIPICSTYSDLDTFKDYLLKVKNDLAESHTYNALPLDVFINELQIDEVECVSDLYDSIVLLEDLHNKTHIEDSEKPLILVFSKNRNDIQITYHYNELFIDSTQINILAKLFHTILTKILVNMDITVREIQAVDEAESNKILNVFNNTDCPYPSKKTLQDLLEEQAEKNPENIAAVFEDKSLTYQQLNENSNQFARKLRENGVQRETIVPIIAERSLEMLIGIFGILKAGGAYLPIDITFPKERIEYILEDSKASIIVTFRNKELIEKNIISISLEENEWYTRDSSNLINLNQPSDLAYVIYTSGTTGNPKGVMIQHNSILNRLNWMIKEYPLTQEDVILQKTPYTFDVSIWEIFIWQLSGSSVVLLPPNAEKDAESVVKAIKENNVTVIHFVPSMLGIFLQYIDSLNERMSFKRLKYLFASGEALHFNQVEQTRKIMNLDVINLYGPTEATIDVTYYNCDTATTEIIPIGKPIDNSKIYILDKDHNLMPIGVIGEICIGGIGVAKGYLNKQELTEEKFIINPFSSQEKMYKTGDYGRWLADGNIEYLGRFDSQIKIRGFRIEIKEIEIAIKKYVGIHTAVLLVKEDKSGDKYLVAYINEIKQNNEQIKDYLRQTLPEYMIPNFIVRVKSMPVTANGKLDRKALLAIDNIEQKQVIHSEFSNKVEKQLKEIWVNILNVNQIGNKDNFFELGGHSLKAMNLQLQIHENWKVLIPLQDIFNYPTIEEISKIILLAKPSLQNIIYPTKKEICYPASSAQKRIFVMDQLDSNGISYHMPFIVKLQGKVDILKIEEVIKSLIVRHELLRTSFEIRDDEMVQIISPIVNFKLLVRTASINEIETSINQFIYPFNLNQAPLFRAQLVKVEKELSILMLDMHHIISDGASMAILIREFMDLYRGKKLIPLSLQYKDYSVWQKEQLNTESYKNQESYWLSVFEDKPPIMELPTNFLRSQTQSFEGDRFSFFLDKDLTRKLKYLAEKTDSSLYMVLLAGYNILLHKYTGQTDIVVGSPVAGRTNKETQNMLGVFVNTLAMRSNPEGKKSFLTFLKEVREFSLKAYENQDYPFEELIENLNLQRDISRNPLFDTMFIFQNIEMENFKLNDLSTVVYPYHMKTAKVDITLEAVEINDGLSCHFEYNTSLFKNEMIAKMSKHYIHILEEVIIKSNDELSTIEIITEEELLQIEEVFNNTVTNLPRDTNLQQLIEKQVHVNPDKVAVVYETIELTYRELNERSNQIANYLQLEKKVKAGDLIGIMMERTEKMLVILLGILKAGGAYVPLDPSYPSDRINYILSDSQLKTIILEDKYIELIKGFKQKIDFIILEDEQSQIKQYSIQNTLNNSKALDLVYVIYTSGSTGNPKGVMVNHHNIINFFAGMDQRIPSSNQNVFFSVTTISFDISILELFWTLTKGMSIVLRASDEYQMNYDRYLIEPNIDMDFSLFFFSSYNLQENQDKYKLLFESAQFADENGFTAIWTPERHFHEFGGLYPNPSITSSALAMITKNIHLRSGSIVSPLHDSIRIAEEWSMIDNISKGRIGLSFASGWHADDFVIESKNYQNRTKTMFQQIQEVRDLWHGRSILRTNGVGKEVEIRTYPRPLQEELPIWVTTAGNKESFIEAGKIGANVLTHMLGQDLLRLQENIVAYRSTLKEYGHSADKGNVTLMLHTFIGEDLEEVKAKVKQPFCNYLRSSINLIRNLAEELKISLEELNNSEDMINTLVEIAFERYWQSSSLIGTATTALNMIRKLNNIGVNEIACLVDFGLQDSDIRDSLQLLTKLKDSLNTFNDTSARPITMMQTTPSRLNAILKDENSKRFISSLSTLLIGGEALSDDLIEKVKQTTNAEIYNMYGPTETTIWSSMHQVKNKSNLNNIGNPIANTQMYILNKDLNVLPVGIIGEIYIGGQGVVHGYLNRKDLTAEKFIERPSLLHRHSGKIYKTGDLGKYLPDGTIQFHGRNDSQVKIRGYRIELGEIEAVLLAHSALEEVAVIDEDKNNSKRLVAFYVSHHEIENNEIRQYLMNKLPFYMLPSLFVSLSKLPLTPNGKIDRVSLRNFEHESSTESNSIQGPQNKVEELLVSVWESVLGVENINIQDDFFQLGGDSIKAIQVSSRLRNHRLELDIRDLFKYSTIASLSSYLKETKILIVQNSIEGEIILTPIQNWFFDNYGLDTEKQHYNHSIMLFNQNGFKEQYIEAVFEKILQHHDALRMTFKQESHKLIQYNRAYKEKLFGLNIYDLTDEKEPNAMLKAKMTKLQGMLNLENGPLVRIALFKTLSGDHLLIIIHHLIIDGVSWRILLEDFNTGYLQASQGKSINFPLKTNSFQDWSTYLRTNSFEEELKYWNNIEQQKFEKLPVDQYILESKIGNTKRLTANLSIDNTEKLIKQANITFGTEINELLLTALGYALKEWTHGLNFKVDMESYGRLSNQIEVSRTVGWFTSLYPIILNMSEQSENLLDQIKIIKEINRSVPNLGIGYGALKYQTDSGLKTNNAEILFNYLGQFDQDVQSDIYEISSIETINTISSQLNRIHKLEMVGMVTQGQLHFSIDYDYNEFKEENINYFISSFIRNLENIINYCTNKKNVELTYGDLSVRSISKEEVKHFLNDDNVEDIYELSPMQKGILFHSVLEKEVGTYFQQFIFKISGVIKIDYLEKSLKIIIDRHEILRTKFEYRDSKQPLQIVMRERSPRVYFLDISDYTEINKKNYIDSFILSDKNQGFNVENDELIRVSVLKISLTEYQLIFSYHHIIMDGWCMSVIFNELFYIYNSLLLQNPIELETVHPYKNYINWLYEQNSEEASKYWRKYLKGFEKNKIIKTDNSFTKTGYSLAGEMIVLEKDITSTLKKFAIKNKCTMHTLIATIWGVMLQKINNTQDVLFGTVVSGRPAQLEGIEQTIGLFINTIPIRISSEKEMLFSELLRNIQEDSLMSEKFSYYPLYEIQREHSHLDHILLFENYPLQEELQSLGKGSHNKIEITEIEVFEQTNYDFNLLIEMNDTITFRIKYNAKVFERQYVKNLLNFFIELINTALNERMKMLSHFDLIASKYIEELPLKKLGQIPSVSNEMEMTISNVSSPTEILNENNIIENKLIIIWEEIFNLSDINQTVNFFDLGGHSLNIMELISKVHMAFGIQISLSDVFNYSTIQELSNFIYTQQRNDSFHPILLAEEKQYYPLSSAQFSRYITHSYSGGNIINNIPKIIKINGPFSLEHCNDILRVLINRHETLRTSFKLINGEPVQVIHSTIDFQIIELDDYYTSINELAQSFIKPFDLASAPLLRTGIKKISELEYYLVFDLHHIITDGFSLSIFINEFISLYDGKILNPLSLQYKDYSEWHRNYYLNSSEFKEHEKYWNNMYSNEVLPLQMPTDYPRVINQKYQGNEIRFSIDEILTTKLKEMVTKSSTSLFMFLLSTYNLFLHKYTGQEDIVVGTAIAGRHHPDVRNIMGIFVNTLAIRNKLNHQMKFSDFLQEVKENVLNAYDNQDYPFEKLIDNLEIKRHTGRHPLFDTMFVMQNIDFPDFTANDVRFTSIDLHTHTSNFDFKLEAFEGEGKLSFILEYNTQLFKEETMKKWVSHYLTLIESVTKDMNKTLSEIQIISMEERKSIETDFNTIL